MLSAVYLDDCWFINNIIIFYIKTLLWKPLDSQSYLPTWPIYFILFFSDRDDLQMSHQESKTRETPQYALWANFDSYGMSDGVDERGRECETAG